MRTLKIKNKDYPLHFGKSFLRKIETDADITLTNLGNLLDQSPINTSLNMLHISLIEGARKQKTEMSFTIDELVDIWDDEDDMVEIFMKELNATFLPDKEKKVKPQVKK